MFMTNKEVFNKMALLCSRKEYCSFDVSQKMKKWDISEEAQEEVIIDLIKEKYIDEKRFAEAFVKDKFRFNKWGKQKIQYQLKQKQITNNDIEDAFAQITEEDYNVSIDAILLSKNRSIKAKDSYDHKNKLLRFMIQKGFEMDMVLKRIEILTEELQIN